MSILVYSILIVGFVHYVIFNCFYICIPGALTDPDLNVRRVALVAFNSAAHNKPSLIRDLLRSMLPHLYNETQKRKELIREVEMGPFKHEVSRLTIRNPDM